MYLHCVCVCVCVCLYITVDVQHWNKNILDTYTILENKEEGGRVRTESRFLVSIASNSKVILNNQNELQCF